MKYLENLMIYFGNLSAFYIFSVATSIAVVLLTIYLGIVTRLTNGSPEQADKKSFHKSQNQSSTGGDGTDDSDSENENLRIESLRQLKSAKLKSIERRLTDEQRQAEKEMEKAQLSAIFELLKQQSEKFDLCADLNEDDLKEQLTLYR
uniref:Protein with signal anchor n=1 Tax=Aedes albopictus TaxID=7160 RepID=A0A1W7R853_AEDAL